ncbi:predicted protein [Lichtheimia corymbifera JMRC:FSU:9682]|uniref:Uncharacterized protein n=1 Tax=Lichtheimia corymbifera JMRC:FSU:9682 TaxID=1263082 RepID=A0A068RYR7_9FUNG|nr:predicted protein [Lichtheimia corymbifera JMRC:FSU:9682]
MILNASEEQKKQLLFSTRALERSLGQNPGRIGGPLTCQTNDSDALQQRLALLFTFGVVHVQLAIISLIQFQLTTAFDCGQ